MKRCPYCSAALHDEALVCRSCGRDLLRAAPVQAPTRRFPQPGSNLGGLLAGSLMVVACLLCVAASVLSSTGGISRGSDRSDAVTVCRKLVQDELGSPVEVHFPPSREDRIRTVARDEYEVQGSAQVTDAAGVQSETRYTCTVAATSGGLWRLISLRFEE